MLQNICTIAMILCCYLGSYAQTLRMDQVPKDAAHALHTRYPAAQQESWQQIAQDAYQVGFYDVKKRRTAQYDGSGKWIQTETEITLTQVPRGVSGAISRQFAGYEVQQVSELATPDRDTPTYEVVLFKGKVNYDVIFSAKGEVLKKEEGSSE